MLELIAHRGPDDAGLMVDDRCVLGHRRLSIIDLSPAGHQPMASADGRLWITYNGEVYNYLELRGSLEELGRAFRTETDTEVLLQAYEEWGTAALDRLNGMFAFAIWDRQRRSLFCARDRLGSQALLLRGCERSVSVRVGDQGALRRPELSRAPNDARVLDFLAWGLADHTSETMFAGVLQLPAGSYMRVDARGVGEPVRWYTPHAQAGIRPGRQRCDSSSKARSSSVCGATCRSACSCPAEWTRRPCLRWPLRSSGVAEAASPSRSRLVRASPRSTSTGTPRHCSERRDRETRISCPPATNSRPRSTRSSGSSTSLSTTRRCTRIESFSSWLAVTGSSCCSTGPGVTRRCRDITTCTTQRCSSPCCAKGASCASFARFATAARSSVSRTDEPRRIS